MKWFKHDADAHGDAKLFKVRIKYGMEGYGLYWYCLEKISMGVDVNKLTFELEHDSEIIAHDTGIHYERVQEMMAYMVDLGLFESDQGVITCRKLLRRLDQSMTSNTHMRKLIDKAKNNHDGVMTVPDSVMQDKSRLDKKRKTYRAAKRVPQQWKISQEGKKFAKKQGMSDSVLDEQLDAFRDHEYKTARKDWDAAWRTWCRNWKEWNPGKVVQTEPYKHRKPYKPTEEEIQRDREKAEKEMAAWAAK